LSAKKSFLNSVVAAACSLFLWTITPALAAEAKDETGFAGMEIQDADLGLRQALGLSEGRGGIMVRDIAPGGPADQAQLQRGELLLGFEGIRIENLRQVVAYMQSTKPGQKIRFDIWRDGARSERQIILENWPDGWRINTSSFAVVPRLGVTLVALTPEVRQANGLRWGRTGVLLRSLEENALALTYGLESGDLVVAVGRTPVVDPALVDGLLAAMGDQWFLLVERDNQVALVGPNVGTLGLDSLEKGAVSSAVPLVVGDHLLVARLPDGPYVMDRDLMAGDAPTIGSAVDPMPAPRTWAKEQEKIIHGVGIGVATVSQERQQELRLHWSTRGLVITHVDANSAAQKAGLASKHVITAINGKLNPSIEDLEQALEGKAGDESAVAALLVQARNGFFLAALSARPSVEGEPQMLDILKKFSETPQ
jgi:S1-C subfamily serine protease